MAQLASTTVFGELSVTANSLLQGNVGIGTTSPAYALDVSGDVRATGTFRGSLTGNASTATTLATARTINGTSFNGSANITTANWGTARTITIGNTGKSVNGSGNVSWSLAEIGAAPATHTHSNISITAGNGLSGGGTLAANRTITLGTPGTITTSTSNSVTSTGHTHALTLPTQATRWPSWDEVTGKPTTFAPATHSHSSISGGYTGSGGYQAPSYFGRGLHLQMMNNLPGAGSGYFDMIIAHSYISDVPICNTLAMDKSGRGEMYLLQQNANNSAWTNKGKFWHSGNVPATATRWPTWEEVTGKPTTFAPASHTHSYLPLSGGTLSGALTVSSNLTASGVISCSQTSGTAGGISLYSGAGSVTSYGLAFRTTANQGTHGKVTGDWATYFFMSGATNRGWVFKHTTNNVASISGTGELTASKDYNAVYNDYAEYFLKNEEIEAGDIVQKNPDSDGYIKAQSAHSKLVIGVMSTDFAQCIGGDRDVTPEEQEKKYAPVGLAGRVPVKVVGKVELGDLIVSSEIPGVGMASKEYIPGTVVGKALESYDSDEVGKIEMLIMNI